MVASRRVRAPKVLRQRLARGRKWRDREPEASARSGPALLPDPRLLGAQRTTALRDLGRRCGNRAVQRLVATSDTIRRWGPTGHAELVATSTVGTPTKRLLVAPRASAMDFKPEELAFNAGSKLMTNHAALVAYYRAGRNNALNHGEGGCYAIPSASAAPLNRARVDYYVGLARAASRSLRSMPLWSPQRAVMRQVMLQAIGDALHVAQDRGSHSEGGIGRGHDQRVYDPDKRDTNPGGWAQAATNTRDVLTRVMPLI
jgi:hypothetical protein